MIELMTLYFAFLQHGIPHSDLMDPVEEQQIQTQPRDNESSTVTVTIIEGDRNAVKPTTKSDNNFKADESHQLSQSSAESGVQASTAASPSLSSQGEAVDHELSKAATTHQALTNHSSESEAAPATLVHSERNVAHHETTLNTTPSSQEVYRAVPDSTTDDDRMACSAVVDPSVHWTSSICEESITTIQHSSTELTPHTQGSMMALLEEGQPPDDLSETVNQHALIAAAAANESLTDLGDLGDLSTQNDGEMEKCEPSDPITRHELLEHSESNMSSDQTDASASTLPAADPTCYVQEVSTGTEEKTDGRCTKTQQGEYCGWFLSWLVHHTCMFLFSVERNIVLRCSSGVSSKITDCAGNFQA